MTSRGAVRADLERLLRAALAAVDPAAAVRGVVEGGAGAGPTPLRIGGIRLEPDARLVVLAAGKAAAAMTAALEEVAGERIAAGLAVTRDGHALPLRRVEIREAAHPVPDARGLAAARAAIGMVESARPGDVLVVLLSGGASSLLPCPCAGLTLQDLARTTEILLAGGAEIDELNAVRKHLSVVAGGLLARRTVCARTLVLAISDVPGDRVDVIGSGPFAPDPSTYGDALDAIARCRTDDGIPTAVMAHLEAGRRGEREETPKPGDPVFDRVRTRILATNTTALGAACAAAEQSGSRAVALPGALRGEARHAGRRLAALAASLAPRESRVLVAGGETVVTVRGGGRGGRNQELALAAALELEGRAEVSLLAAGTDGTDGPTDAAGAFADGETVARGRRCGYEARAALDDNDAYGFFSVEGGILRTGPTLTNVMDLALVRVAGFGSKRPG